MTGVIVPPPPSKEFLCCEDGLSFTVKLYVNDLGIMMAKLTVVEGAADFNALYFGDDTDDGSSFGFGKSDTNLNMNGAGTVDHEGNPVDWDGGIKLSEPGLGKAGTAKETYLTAGETLYIPLPGVESWDDVENIGVRATSTTTPEGSIKCVATDLDDEDEDAHDDKEPSEEVAVDNSDTDTPPETKQEAAPETDDSAFYADLCRPPESESGAFADTEVEDEPEMEDA